MPSWEKVDRQSARCGHTRTSEQLPAATAAPENPGVLSLSTPSVHSRVLTPKRPELLAGSEEESAPSGSL
ncbi:hypothetical protein H920_12752 [Fukomys damarensis]|uniref:Uncharacterized protein n=1 Tax=Fukomys damarensis TaxID=885580 RepID=A0A091D149_FUKDA|nr:hypothetical protein H920_12752 [Fukomys damarensis]